MGRKWRTMVIIPVILTLLGTGTLFAQENDGVAYPASPYGADLQQTLSFADIEGHWARGAIVRQTALGTMAAPAANRFNPNVSATRQEAIRAVLALVGMEGDWENYLEQAQQVGIITPVEVQELNWDSGVRRQEMAAWLARALNLETPETMRRLRGFQDWTDVASDYMGEVESLLAHGYLQGVGPGVLAPNRILTRGEMAALLDRSSRELLTNLGVTLGEGQYIGGESRIIYPGGQGVRQTIHQVLVGPGRQIAIETLEPQGASVAIPQRLVVNRDGRVGGAELLRVGDRVTYYVSQGEVFLVDVGEGISQRLQGRIDGIDQEGRWLDFISLWGERSRFEIGPASEVVLNGRPGRVGELFPGQEAELQVEGGIVSRVFAFLPEGEGGYIAAGSRVREGQVMYLDGDTLVLRDNRGNQEAYGITPATAITREGTRLRPQDLRAGDRVTLHFDDLETKEAARVQVAGSRGHIRDIYRGVLTFVSPQTREVVLSQPSRFNILEWERVAAPLRLELQSGAQIFAGDQGITTGDLAKSYIGQEVFVAVAEGLGRKQGVQLLIKDGFTRDYYGQIDHIDWVAQELELEGNYLQYDAGTFFLWEDRLIAPLALERGQEALVLASTSGTAAPRALVVSVEDVREPELDIFRGTVERLGLNHIGLRRISELDGHRWIDRGRRSTLTRNLNQDTLFWDNTGSQEGKLLTKWEFDQTRVEEDFQDTFGLVLSWGEETVAVGLWSEEPTGDRVTSGRIRGLDLERGLVTLERVKDWSPALGQWRFYPGAMSVDVKEAVVVGKGSGISWEELGVGQQVYLLREGMQGILLLVQ